MFNFEYTEFAEQIANQKLAIAKLEKSINDLFLDLIDREIDSRMETINQIKDQLQKAEDELKPFKKKRLELEVIYQLQSGRRLAFLTESDLDSLVYEMNENGQLNVSIEDGTIVYRLRSKYTVTKDCGVDDVGWNFDAYDDYTLYDSTGKEMDISEDVIDLDYLLRQIKEDYADDIDSDGRPEYDGDHHGVWAYGKRSFEVSFYQLKNGPSNSDSEDEISEESRSNSSENESAF